MNLSYKAYISYKHEDLDTKIATLIEKGLESYRIPYKTRKKTGVKKIEKIFRDKEELPITNDLSGTISGALENSEYMIVICSPNTGLSNLVENEIKLFLQNHTQDKILAVLAEGEPREVIPQILNRDEISVFDFRSTDKFPVNIELSKIASVLIGCSKDELIRSKRPLNIGWMIAAIAGIMAICAGICGYQLHCKKKVQESYYQALTNQSLYLSNESDKMLSEKERLTAVQLALAALPDETDPERPVIPEAVRAITNATLSYVSNTTANCESIRDYTMPDNIEAYESSPNGRFLVAMDISHNIKLWDTANNTEVFNAANSDFSKTIFIGNDAILLCGANELRAVNTATGAPIWHAVPQKGESFSGKLVVLSGKTLLVPNDHGSVYRMSATDGSTEDIYNLNSKPSDEEEKPSDEKKKASDEKKKPADKKKKPTDEEKKTSDEEKKPAPATIRNIEDIVSSPTGDKFAFITTGPSLTKDTLVIYDTKEKKSHEIVLDKEEKYNAKDYIAGIFWPRDENLYYSVSLTDPKKNETINDTLIQTENHSEIVCLNSEDYSTSWEYTLVYTSMSYKMDITYLPSRHAVAIYEGNMFKVIDNNTGEVMNTCDLNEPIVSLNISGNTPYPIVVTESGLMSKLELSSENAIAYSYRYFPNNIDNSAGKNDFFIHKKDSNEIMHFKNNVYDSGLAEFTDCPDFTLINDSNTFMSENIAVIFNKVNGIVYASYFDAVSKKFLGNADLAIGNIKYFKLLGTYENKIYISYIDTKVTVYEIDVTSGEKKAYDLNIGDLTPKHFGDIYFDNGWIAYVTEKGDNKYIELKNYILNKSECHLISPSYKINNISFDHDAGIIYASCNDKDFMLLSSDPRAKDVALPEKWGHTTDVNIIKNEQKIVLSNGSRIIVKDYSANTLYEIKCPALKPYGAYIYTPEDTSEKKLLLVPFEKGFLFRYDADTGEYLGQSEYTATQNSAVLHQMAFGYDTDNDLLFIHHNSVLSVIDINSWLEITAVDSCFGYNNESDTFIVSVRDKNNAVKLGYFRHYTLDELIKKGKSIVGDIKMSDEKKAEYGIG